MNESYDIYVRVFKTIMMPLSGSWLERTSLIRPYQSVNASVERVKELMWAELEEVSLENGRYSSN